MKGFPKNKWFIPLIILAFTLLVMLLMKKIRGPIPEGFTQDSPFISKRNNQIYDSYYAMIYDDLYRPIPRVEYEYQKIIDMTHPTKNNSVFLDIGAGTGHLVNALTAKGYEAYGMDKSQAMVDVALQKYPDNNIRFGDAMDAMTFDRDTFTHITCMNMTIYEIREKAAFFRNCYFWLKPNGYLILHLVDPAQYNPIIPAAIPKMIDNPQKYTKKRITDSAVDFSNFTYKQSTDFLKQGEGEVVVKETFKDTRSGNVRENENTLYMMPVSNILYIAQQCGFIMHSQTTYKVDDYQYLFILEKIQ